MRARVVIGLGALVAVFGCSLTPRKVDCETYVAGGFNAENGYALSVNAAGWPRFRRPDERIELTFLFTRRTPPAVDLVHVLDSREIERWALTVPVNEARVPTCFISTDPSLSTCGASIRVVPHDPGGYYYLRTDGDIVEAGMSFRLCVSQTGSAP